MEGLCGDAGGLELIWNEEALCLRNIGSCKLCQRHVLLQPPGCRFFIPSFISIDSIYLDTSCLLLERLQQSDDRKWGERGTENAMQQGCIIYCSFKCIVRAEISHFTVTKTDKTSIRIHFKRDLSMPDEVTWIIDFLLKNLDDKSWLHVGSGDLPA